MKNNEKIKNSFQAKDKRIALVTGGNRGIGFESCRQLAEMGMTVLLTARDMTKGMLSTKRLLDEGLDVDFLKLDVSNKDDINGVAGEVEQRFGRLDVLVNNAAILYDAWQHAVDADLEMVNQALKTNLYGPWQMCKAFIPLMRKNGYGRIVNVSSGAGSLHSMGGGAPAYGISKVALNALTRKLASELLGTGILVNAVDPGWVATDMGGSGGRPVQDGARGIVWAATLPSDTEGSLTGGFFYDGKPEPW
jgi:NAD(P)-dependent dehydrogenase (short-subunit alcohol dehydrogenase family)